MKGKNLSCLELSAKKSVILHCSDVHQEGTSPQPGPSVSPGTSSGLGLKQETELPTY